MPADSNLAIINNEQQKPALQFSQEQVELVKRTVAKGATNDELQMFMYLSQKYGLDPFAKEIWFIKYGGTPTIMTSRDGYLKIAQNHPDFLGIISFVVCEGDEFAIDAANFAVHHKFGSKRGRIIGAWARCDRKKRNPQICFVSFDEHRDAKSSTWNRYPSAMIQKVAETFVLKRQFTISGLVTNEELNIEPNSNGQVDYQAPVNGQVQNDGQKQNSFDIERARRMFYAEMEDLAAKVGVDKDYAADKAKQLVYGKFGVNSMTELTPEQWASVIKSIDSLKEATVKVINKALEADVGAEIKNGDLPFDSEDHLFPPDQAGA